jgi:hypothetical protein
VSTWRSWAWTRLAPDASAGGCAGKPLFKLRHDPVAQESERPAPGHSGTGRAAG